MIFIASDLFVNYDDVVTVDDVKSMLHIGKNAVYDLLHDGTIKSYRNGKTYIIPKQSVINFVNNIVATPQLDMIKS